MTCYNLSFKPCHFQHSEYVIRKHRSECQQYYCASTFNSINACSKLRYQVVNKSKPAADNESEVYNSRRQGSTRVDCVERDVKQIQVDRRLWGPQLYQPESYPVSVKYVNFLILVSYFFITRLDLKASPSQKVDLTLNPTLT